MVNSGSSARFIKPPNLFKQKVGSGGISPKKLDKAQEYIANVNVDFHPFAQDFMTQYKAAVEKAKKSPKEFKGLKDDIVNPIMELKANGGMFQYNLISMVADIAMHFLDTIDEMNDDTYKVLKAHENTLEVILKNKLTGSGGKAGLALVRELEMACKRYFQKHSEEKE